MLLLITAVTALLLTAADHQWQQVPLPKPATASTQQTGLLVANLDKQPAGATGFVISYRVKGPALIWYHRHQQTWTQTIIEPDFLPLEAGGAAHDIDNDGDLDIVFGADSSNVQLWWWENPYPDFAAAPRWRRHIIKEDGARQHHDQVFADLTGAGRPQLIFWNQRAKTLFLAPIPGNPRETTAPWPRTAIFEGLAGEGATSGAAAYAEGIDAFDVDGDGRTDLLAGNSWFRRRTAADRAARFEPVRIGTIGGRIRAGRFHKQGRNAQVVIAPGDGSGPLRFYECTKGDAADPSCWQGRDLLDRDMVHGHTLDLGDLNGDGNLDIFAAEMAKWSNREGVIDHPAATAWILYGDGKGGFRRTILVTGHGWHEGKLADVDGDGDLDIINKPYTWSAPRVDVWLNNGTRRARRSK